jgi:hypothetical protein
VNTLDVLEIVEDAMQAEVKGFMGILRFIVSKWYLVLVLAACGFLVYMAGFNDGQNEEIEATRRRKYGAFLKEGSE